MILMYIPGFQIYNDDEFTFNGIERERSRRFDSFAPSSLLLWIRGQWWYSSHPTHSMNSKDLSSTILCMELLIQRVATSSVNF